MRRIISSLVFTLLCTVSSLGEAQEASASQAKLLAQVALLPPREGPHPDLERLLKIFWPDYFMGEGRLSFGLDQIRVGRVDLNDDDEMELILMIDQPGWKVAAGKPFVISTWDHDGWRAIGWGWSDEDHIWTLAEVNEGWHSLDVGTQIERWKGGGYEATDQEGAPPPHKTPNNPTDQ